MVDETRTSPDGDREWTIDDEPVQFRLWGTDRSIELPRPAIGSEWSIGSSSTCWLPLKDANHYTSRQHAKLRREPRGWLLDDLGSKNGTWEDNARRPQITLYPGVEIGIGRYRLVVESPRSIALRELLARLLGWASSRYRVIDRALRALRKSATLTAPLSLSGEGDMVAIARQLHRATLGPSKPFVVSDPERQPGAESTRGPANYVRSVAGFDAADGGTLCVWSDRLPSDFAEMRALIDEPGHRVRLVICSRKPLDTSAAAINIPPLESRPHEVARIIAEYAREAIDLLKAKPTSFSARDHLSLLEKRLRSIPDIERATLRLTAINEYGGTAKAATRLGLDPSAMSRWHSRLLRRR